MFVTVVSTITNNKKERSAGFQKRTQTKPNLPALAGKFALSAVEGPVVINLSRAQSRDLLKRCGNFVNLNRLRLTGNEL